MKFDGIAESGDPQSGIFGIFIGDTSEPSSGGPHDNGSGIEPAGSESSEASAGSVTTGLANISVAGFRERHNERQDFLFTTIAPVLENGASPSQERVFPQLLNGDGFTTQIILYSGTAGNTSQGNMSFIRPDGTPFILDIH